MAAPTTTTAHRPRRRRRIPGRALAAVAAAGVAALVLTSCNPPAGQAQVKVTGNVVGETNGPKVTCETSAPGVTIATWTGLLAGKPTTLKVYGGIEGDLDGIQLDHNGKQYLRLEHGLRQVDSYGVIHVDSTAATNATPSQQVRIVAALHCP